MTDLFLNIDRPVLWMPIGEGSLNIIHDLSKYGSHGTNNGGTWVADELVFDGINDYIDTATSPGGEPQVDIFGKTEFTVFAEINAVSDGENNFGRIVDKVHLTIRGYRFYVWGEAAGTVRLRAFVGHDGVTDAIAITSTTLSLNVDHSVAFVYNEDGANRIKIYIDEVLATLSTDTPGVGAISDDTANNLWIGNRAGLDRTFDGVIKNVKAFETAYSATEIGYLDGDGNLTHRVERGDIFRESLSGVGTWKAILQNPDNVLGGTINPEDSAEIWMDGVSMMRGYVDDVMPEVSDKLAVYLEKATVPGRDFGQDLANLFVTKNYYNTAIDDVIDDMLATALAEITYTSPTALTPYDVTCHRRQLIDKFKDLAKLDDADFYVDDFKRLHLFLLGAEASGVTLKSVTGALDNNILSLSPIGEQVGFDIYNYIDIESGEVNDHYTEHNAGDYINVGCNIADDAMIFLSGDAAIRATLTAATFEMWADFTLYDYAYLDYSWLGTVDCWCLFRHNGAANRYIDIILEDDAGCQIGFSSDIPPFAAPPYVANTWYKRVFPVGPDNIINAIPTINQWWFLPGSAAPFSWRIARGGIRSTNAVIGEQFWFDGLVLKTITPRSIAQDAASQLLYRRRMLALSRSDIQSQVQLDVLATDELAKRKDPTEKIHVVAHGQTATKYAGQTVIVNAPQSGINNVVYRILSVHPACSPRNDIFPPRGVDFISEYDLVRHQVDGNTQKTDPLRFRLSSSPVDTQIARLFEITKNLENRVLQPPQR